MQTTQQKALRPPQKQTQVDTPNWIRAVDTQVEKLLGHYIGSREEQTAQAIVDLMNKQVEKYQLSGQLLGGYLLSVRAKRLYKTLGYSSMEEFITSERVGGIGCTRSYQLMKIAQHTAPPNMLSAPTLSAPILNGQTGRLLMSSDFVSKIGIDRAYALAQKWDKSSPEHREELLNAAEHADNKGFFDSAYGDSDKVSFEVTGDVILHWKDSVGTEPAVFKTLDPVIRSDVMDRLNTVPRARL